MTKDEMRGLADSIMGSVKAYVDNAIADAQVKFEMRLTTTQEAMAMTVVERLADLPKPKDGDPGPAGDPGKDAEPAAVAEALLPALKSMVDAAVAAIPPPANGKDGIGVMGEPGLDAAQLAILSDIDISRSYAKRSWASIDGGLWRAARRTTAGEADPAKAGWECMVDGIKGIQIDADASTRELSLVVERTSGEKILRTVELPMMLWRGSHELGKEYSQGDSVACDGSAWVADCKTTGIPGASPDWKLIAKKGRDFRPVNRTEPKDEPVRLR